MRQLSIFLIRLLGEDTVKEVTFKLVGLKALPEKERESNLVGQV